MKQAALVAAATAMLAIAATAATAAAPAHGRLIVSSPATHVGVAARIHITSIPAPGTYRTRVFVPAGYRAPGGLGAVGNNVGKAHVYVKQGDGSRVTLNGQLSVLPHTQTPLTGCSSATNQHAAVWVLKANQTGGTGTVTFPIFVDSQTTDTKLPATAAYVLQWCAGATGLDIAEVDLDLVRMFTNPQARGIYMWRSVYEPAAGNGEADTAGAVSTVSAVPISPQVTMRVTKPVGRSQAVTLAGAVTVANKGLAGVRVQVFLGRQHRLALNQARATVRTRSDGSYRVVLRLTGGGHWYARATASTPYLDITRGGGCQGADPDGLAARGCVDATLAPFIVRSPVAQLR